MSNVGGFSGELGTKRSSTRFPCGSPSSHNGDAVSTADNRNSADSSGGISIAEVLGLRQTLAKWFNLLQFLQVLP